MLEETLRKGSCEDYQWLTADEYYSGTVLQACPQIVVGQFVAMTSNDSGVAHLSDSDLKSGWTLRQEIGYSPKIQFIDEIPFQLDCPDAPGYDELYIFDKPHDLGKRMQGDIFTEEEGPGPGKLAVFVNFRDFKLHDAIGSGSIFSDLFWGQLALVRPVSYLADGWDCLTFVTRDEVLFADVWERLSQGSDVKP